MASGYCRWPCRREIDQPVRARAAARCGSSRRSGPASRHARDDPQARRGRRRRLPDQHEPRHPRRSCAADRDDPRAREGARPADDDPRRPAGAQAARRQVRGRQGRARRTARPSSSTATTTPGDAKRVEPAAPRDFRRRSSRARGCWSTTASSSSGSSRRDRDRIETERRGRRHASRTTRASTSPTWCCRSPR